MAWSSAAEPPNPSSGGSAGRRPLVRPALLLWEAGAFVFTVIAASALHFLYEFSGFQPWAPVFGAVNESTFEHLKLFFWPAFAYALLQYAFTRRRVNNFWWGKALGMVTTPLVLMLSFYAYLSIALPIYGRGFLWADIGTGVLGVLAGNIVSYRTMTRPEMGRVFARAGLAIALVLGAMFAAFTYYPPRLFLFENLVNHRYSGEYGILGEVAP